MLSQISENLQKGKGKIVKNPCTKCRGVGRTRIQKTVCHDHSDRVALLLAGRRDRLLISHLARQMLDQCPLLAADTSLSRKSLRDRNRTYSCPLCYV